MVFDAHSPLSRLPLYDYSGINDPSAGDDGLAELDVAVAAHASTILHKPQKVLASAPSTRGKNLSSARHYDQIRFRFHTAETQSRHAMAGNRIGPRPTRQSPRRRRLNSRQAKSAQ
jgi:hypothetical protein